MIGGTLVFLVRGNEVLLAHKKRGIGAGYWNGPGGKIEPGETPRQAMIRECQEEIGVTPITFHQAAVIEFEAFHNDQPVRYPIHAFICTEWKGQPHATDEMEPRWFKTAAVPYDQMWEDDQYWLPLILQGQIITGHCHFDQKGTLTSYTAEKMKPPETELQ